VKGWGHERNSPFHAKFVLMTLFLNRRLIPATIIIFLVALPCIWFARQYGQVKLNRELIADIKRLDADEVDTLLDSGADPSTRETSHKHESIWQRLRALLHPPTSAISETALMSALTSSDPEDLRSETPRIYRALILACADINARVNNGVTPLIEGGWWGDHDLVGALIAAHADVNLRDDNGWTAYSGCSQWQV
jgi:hypothetical protein